MDKWARQHSECKKCHKTQYSHKALGFCKNCYDASKGYKWQKNYRKNNLTSIREYQKKKAKEDYYLGKRNGSIGNRLKANQKRKIWLNRVAERDGMKCRLCGIAENLTIEHKIPRCVGGKTAMKNLEILCLNCNLKTYHRLVKKALIFYFKNNS